MLAPLVYGSVCSGIEAATVAWHPIGWRPAFFSEIEAFPRAVLQHHYPHVPLHGDFTTIEAGQYDPIELLVGGTPCQSFSVAGLRGGLRDDRGNLALEYLRLAQRLRPQWLVWENVPGVLSSNGGRDFGAILGGMVELGYGFAYRVLDAQHFGVPQRRRRVFVVGYLGDWRPAAAVLFERHSLQGHPPPRREARAGIAGALAGVSPGGGWRVGADEAAGHTVSATLSARRPKGDGVGRAAELIAFDTTQITNGDNRSNPQPGDPCHPLSASGHPPALAFGGNDTRGPIEVATALNAHGGPMGRMDFESETFVTHALTANGFDASEDGTGRGTPLVPVHAHAFDARQTDVIQYGDMTGPLDTDGHSIALAFSCKDHGADAGDISPTLRAMGFTGSHANAGGQVAVAFAPVVSATMTARSSRGGGQTNSPGHNADQQIVVTSGVRRLTPRECERLQSFPDDYTLIPYRGKLAADGPRYKALGNSMNTAVMAWIGRRVELVRQILAHTEAP